MSIKSRIISEDLLKRIAGGDLRGKIRLPAEYDLAEFYQCSRPTVRKAVTELQRAGYVTSVKGSGAYINEQGPGKSAGNLLGSIFPNMGPCYVFDRICGSLAQCASESSYSIVWGGYVSPKSERFEQDILEICRRYVEQRIHGLFFSPFEYHPDRNTINRHVAQIFSTASIPIVLIDSSIEPFPLTGGFDMVSMDHIQAAYVIAEHMIRQGSRRLAFLAPPFSNHTIKMRLIGYHEAVIDNGAAMEQDLFFETAVNDLEALSRFIKTKKPDGILCSNDVTAIGIMHSLEKLNIKIPGDIRLGGFDNLSSSMPFSRPITSIMQPVEEISETALSLITARMAFPQKNIEKIVIPGTLVIGETT